MVPYVKYDKVKWYFEVFTCNSVWSIFLCCGLTALVAVSSRYVMPEVYGWNSYDRYHSRY